MELNNSAKPNFAFTLIELSIVLVIIGLIVGSVLVGQDLIRAAEVRAEISQIEKLNQSVNTFKIKYDGQLPGDINATAANQYGFIEGVLSSDRFSNETALFWSDLANDKLIEGNFSSIVNGNNTITSTSNPLPQAKIGSGNYIAVFSNIAGSAVYANYYYLAAITTTALNSDYIANSAITPLQAYAIDSKIDDGGAQTGRVNTVRANLGIFSDTTYSNNNCAISASQYNILSSSKNNVLCQMAFMFQ